MPDSSCVASGTGLRAGLQYTPTAFLQSMKQFLHRDDYIGAPFISVPGWASEEREREED